MKCTVRYCVTEVLDWQLPANETLRSVLVDAARNLLKIPDKYRDTWTGEVEVEGSTFVVTIGYGADE